MHVGAPVRLPLLAATQLRCATWQHSFTPQRSQSPSLRARTCALRAGSRSKQEASGSSQVHAQRRALAGVFVCGAHVHALEEVLVGLRLKHLHATELTRPAHAAPNAEIERSLQRSIASCCPPTPCTQLALPAREHKVSWQPPHRLRAELAVHVHLARLSVTPKQSPNDPATHSLTSQWHFTQTMRSFLSSFFAHAQTLQCAPGARTAPLKRALCQRRPHADLHLDSVHFTMSARCTRWPRVTLLPAVEWSIVHVSDGHSVAPYTRNAQQGSSHRHVQGLILAWPKARLLPARPARTRQSGSEGRHSGPIPPHPRVGKARC